MLLLDRLGKSAGIVDSGAQARFADLAQRTVQRVFAAVRGVQEDPCERAGELAALVAGASGLLALILDLLAGLALGIGDRLAVQVDQLIAALDKHLGDEHQQHRVTPHGRQPRQLPRRSAARLAGEDPDPSRRQHRQRDHIGAERLQLTELVDLTVDRSGGAVRRRGSQPFKAPSSGPRAERLDRADGAMPRRQRAGVPRGFGPITRPLLLSQETVPAMGRGGAGMVDGPS